MLSKRLEPYREPRTMCYLLFALFKAEIITPVQLVSLHDALDDNC